MILCSRVSVLLIRISDLHDGIHVFKGTFGNKTCRIFINAGIPHQLVVLNEMVDLFS